ncbi:hypothetical protein RB195_025738 [Necator americanus]|uniref:Uncharacterized protein n=1 Tax=Necator americanus TaxID=51031 RepID=A0ABR1ETU6_NECAM
MTIISGNKAEFVSYDSVLCTAADSMNEDIINSDKMQHSLDSIQPLDVESLASVSTSHTAGQYSETEIDVVYRQEMCKRYQHLAPPSKVATENRLRFFDHTVRRSAYRLCRRVQRCPSDSIFKKPSDQERKLWIEVVKEELKTLGVDSQF